MKARPVRILVATENSVPARAAIRFGARLAAASRGEVVVLAIDSPFTHALSGSGGLSSRLAFELNEAARVSSAKALEEAEREAKRTGARIRCASVRPRRVESLAETIARIADRVSADIVVVGGRGEGGPGRWILGSFPTQLVHVVRRPVAVVPDTYPPSRRGLVRILVATDGSKAAAEAVRFGARLSARIPRARLLVLHVSTLTADLSLAGGRLLNSAGFVLELRRADLRMGGAILTAAAREARRLGARVTARYFVPRGRVFAEQAIAREAARQRADLIVVGNSGRTALGNALLGSIAQRVVSLAGRPVVLVRARRR